MPQKSQARATYFRVRHLLTNEYLGNKGYRGYTSKKGILYDSAAQANASLANSVKMSASAHAQSVDLDFQKVLAEHQIENYEIEECRLVVVKRYKTHDPAKPKTPAEKLMHDATKILSRRGKK